MIQYVNVSFTLKYFKMYYFAYQHLLFSTSCITSYMTNNILSLKREEGLTLDHYESSLKQQSPISHQLVVSEVQKISNRRFKKTFGAAVTNRWTSDHWWSMWSKMLVTAALKGLKLCKIHRRYSINTCDDK